MKNVVYGKKMKNLQWTSKPSFIAQKIVNNNLVAIHKIKTS